MAGNPPATLDPPRSKPVAGSAKPADKPKTAKPSTIKALRAGIDACRKRRDLLLPTWRDNVARRVNQPIVQNPTAETVTVSTDWSRTKNKQAQLNFQVPTMRLTARDPAYASQAPLFSAALNFELDRIDAYAALDECHADAINGSGIAFAIVGYEGAFEDVPMPSMDISAYTPEQQQTLREAGNLTDVLVKRPVHEGYFLDRISPACALWPSEFKRSNWKKAPWLGYEGYLPLAEAKRRKRSDGKTPWVDDTFQGETFTAESLSDDIDVIGTETLEPGLYVKFTKLFYYASRFDKDEVHPDCIRCLVFIEDKNDREADPVIDEPFKWQKYVPPSTTMGPDGKPRHTPGRYLGMRTLPIKVLTLTTVSDVAIPPSDTEIGRAQVDELNAHRSLMQRERKTSLSLRWFDANLLDEEVAEQMRAGVQQDMIPVNGPGDRAIGEIARASYPRVNTELLNLVTRDLDESWSMSAAQQGVNARSETTASEVKSTDTWASVKLDYERARTLRFCVELAEGLGGLMQLFADFTQYVEVIGQNGVATLEAWDRTAIAGEYLFKAQPDSSVRLDVTARKAEFIQKYKILRRDPLFNPQDLILEYCDLYGRDPAKVLVPAQPPPKKDPTVRWSLKGEDVRDPLILAFLQKSGVSVTAEEIAAAGQLIANSNVLATPPTPAAGSPAPAMAPSQMPMSPMAGPVSGTNPPHGGAMPQVDPLGQRYGNKGEPRGSAETS